MIKWTGKMAADHAGDIQDVSAPGFPGFDGAGILKELRQALNGEQFSALPTLSDNLNTMALCSAVLLSAKEGRVVNVDELWHEG